MPVRT
ncbi:hypothetical protein YQE_00186, partial [Dendroctonus ponderosae]